MYGGKKERYLAYLSFMNRQAGQIVRTNTNPIVACNNLARACMVAYIGRLIYR